MSLSQYQITIGRQHILGRAEFAAVWCLPLLTFSNQSWANLVHTGAELDAVEGVKEVAGP